MLLNLASVILLNPVTVMVTLAPDAAVVGASIDGAPSTSIVASAVSLGFVAANRSVYVPCGTLAGSLNVKPASVPNVPSLSTVTDPLLSVTVATSVDPLYRLAEILRVPGVKPEPVMDTPFTMFPATIFAEPNVIAGEASTVRLVLAVLPDASVTTMFSVPAAVVDGTTKPTVVLVIKLPFESVTTCVPVGSDVAGVVPTFSQVVAVPLTVSVCSEFAANPLPVMATCAPGLTAASASSFGCTVNVAVADAPFAPMTVIVCAPAVAAVGMTKPELMSIPPFVFMQVKPTGVVALITVESK